MSGIEDLARARQLLSEQIEVLASLRNASTRDPNFKQWRQNTLTAIQRIWPGDPSKGERFRRVPFTAPSTKADPKQIRETYERGCAEAATYLRGLSAELELLGVPAATAATRPASLEPGVAEDDFPTLDLPGGPSLVARPQPASEPTLGAPPLQAAVPVEPAAAPPEPAAPEPPRTRAARTPIGKAVTRSAKSGRRNGSKQRLKDMLGFSEEPVHADAAPVDEESTAGEARTPEAFEPPAQAPVTATSRPEPVEAPEPAVTPKAVAASVSDAAQQAARAFEAAMESMRVVPTASAPPLEAAARHVAPAAPAREPAPAPAPAEATPVAEVPPVAEPAAPAVDPESATIVTPARVVEADAAEAEADVERAMEDFLRLSPVFASTARPVKRLVLGTGGYTAPAALALVALASDLEALDVPDGHRARVRATLLDLARRIDTHELPWDALREAVTFVMENPSIARRVLPLLVPYLDQAA